MSSSFPEPSATDAYYHLYKGKRLLLKVSGTELSSPHFPALAQDITAMARHGVRFILVCGSGEQNTQHYNAYLASRGQAPKQPIRIGGRRVTTLEELEHGVLPASQAIRDSVAALMPEAAILRPEHIHCKRLHELQYVGEPEAVDGLDQNGLVVALSVGSDGATPLNINADETARIVAGHGVNEAIFFTPTGGVIDTGAADRHIVRFLWDDDIGEDGTFAPESRYAHIDVSGGGGGMQKKLGEAKRMLATVEKVVITGLASVRGEIEQILGSGTMIAAKKSVWCHPLGTDDERAIFLALYEAHVRSGAFLKRDMEELLKHVHLIGVSNSILGAFALVPHDDWMEMAAVCSEYNGSGVGDVLVRSARQQALSQGKQRIYSVASSTGMAAILERNGFQNHGAMVDVQHSDPSSYFHLPFVKSYDVEKRGRPTFLCTWQNSTT